MKQTLYYNGDILTMNDRMPSAEALLCQDGRILFAGPLAEARKQAAPDAVLADLHGHTLMPAFLDPHSHITALGATLCLVSLQGCKNLGELKERLLAREQAQPTQPGQWLTGFGYDNTQMEEQAHPTRALLDSISTQFPIMLSHASGHMGVGNSALLAACHIDRNTPDPEGGKIGRDENGEPNGYLEEGAFAMCTKFAPAPSMEQLTEGIMMAQQAYVQRGIATIHDGKLSDGDCKMLRAVADKGLLKADVVGYVDFAQCKEPIPALTNPPVYKNRLRLGGYKAFLDGSPQGRTAWLLEPYEGEESYRGYPIHTDEELCCILTEILHQHQQIIIHCNGDAACDQMIRCMEKTQQDTGILWEPLRPVMIHAQMLHPAMMPRMKALGLIPSFFVAHVYQWGDVHLKNFGMDRASRISPANSALKMGLPFTFHQDTPVLMPDMLKTVQYAAQRLTKNGVLLGKEERIPVWEALKALTVNAAYQYFEEDAKGTLEPGKLADLVILDKNPLTEEIGKIGEIAVLATLKENAVIFKNSAINA